MELSERAKIEKHVREEERALQDERLKAMRGKLVAAVEIAGRGDFLRIKVQEALDFNAQDKLTDEQTVAQIRRVMKAAAP